MNLTQWNRARVDQYAERRHISQAEARATLLIIYGPQLDINAVDREMDPHLEPHLQSSNRKQYTKYNHHETTL